ncbi:DinB family protein [Paenibacillus sp. JNUCC31]|uniref:DinB family protein n=1 Tax=Paenibacillus sp. JNUCC-31 TaxID=2777983 RepID=UPI00177C3641|nr:DinB family protein [Paenibacillus sp. JNUCC-31]QOS79445.1 DinB family protein [Paenibacillus sp. JNUCC-31]
MLINDSLAIIEHYKQRLAGYTIDQLRYKSQEDVWSIGQMYIHVIDVAEEYIDHIQICIMATQEIYEGKTEDGTKAFIEKAWPDVRVKLEEPVNRTRNPDSKDEIIAGLEQVQKKLKYWEEHIHGTNQACKVRHGWFGWLNAREWFEMINMHSRHHLRQKARLDEKLAEAGLCNNSLS